MKAVYPGTFDPMTVGHADLVARAARIFTEVTVAIARSAAKNPLLSLEERLEAARITCAPHKNVRVETFDGLLKDFVSAKGFEAVIRGVRATSDFEYEFQMAGMNRQLMPEVETVFLTPADQHQFISGTFVREIAILGADEAAKFVVPEAWPILKAAAVRKRAAAAR